MKVQENSNSLKSNLKFFTDKGTKIVDRMLPIVQSLNIANYRWNHIIVRHFDIRNLLSLL